jgi:hypothetical protein
MNLKDIPNLPMTASIRKTSELTGISYGALKMLADKGEIISIPTEGKKIMLSVWSVIEKFHLVPVDVMKEIWKGE